MHVYCVAIVTFKNVILSFTYTHIFQDAPPDKKKSKKLVSLTIIIHELTAVFCLCRIFELSSPIGYKEGASHVLHLSLPDNLQDVSSLEVFTYIQQLIFTLISML